MSEDKLVFDLDVKLILVEFNKKDGTKFKCELREMDGENRDKYLDGVKKNAIINVKGEVEAIKTFEGSQSSLLSRCLYRNDELVPEKEIQTFPTSVLMKLFEKAQELNALTPKAKEKAKNV